MTVDWSRIDYIGFIFAILVACGGIFGYVKAQSMASLAAGVTFGILLGIGAYLTSFFDPPKPLLQLVAAIMLAFVMGFRFYGSRKVMPAGLIFIISVGVIVRDFIIYRKYLPFIGDN
ncbi:hypothetical protein PVAND_016830 [Polypedilum vanderplanki]|uniref:Transmembrane protein 14C n=1 Tax=Polypedilum vanderplanki TaxID=319348 RepID=A0A9J6BHI4_POLVA|nr:hypothetical protein PVAND_016830 [Polypedilum vanderplanki]